MEESIFTDMKARGFAKLLALVLCSLALFAESPKVEGVSSAPEGVSHDVGAALEAKGCRVVLEDGWTAELWLAKDARLASTGGSDELYPQLSNGQFVGVLHLPKGMSDFRGQAVPPGSYTLRYQLLPQDANHLGVSPNPDFLLATPAADDTKPDAIYPLAKLVALSAKSTGAHPAVIALDKAHEPGTAIFDEQKLLILTVSVSSGSEKSFPMGIVLRGQAAQ